MSKVMKLLFLPAFFLLALIAACNKSEETTTEEAVDQALYSIQERGGVGRFGCFELVFPASLSLPDGTTAEVDSYDAMKQTLRTYFVASGTGRQQVSFVFPISVVSEDGELITIDDDSELRALRIACGRATLANHDPRGHGDRRLSCFEVVFPITIRFADGTTATADDRQALHQLLRRWHNEHPTATGRPQITFPMTVKMTEDGSIVTVNNREELRALKEGCE